jgi:VWFA-related protein
MNLRNLAISCFITAALSITAIAQKSSDKEKQNVRTVTIPISIFTKQELQQEQLEEFIHVERLMVKEDKDDQTILSVRSVASTPLSLAVLIQEDLTSNINLQLKDLRDFINRLPKGSRVMVGYIHGGTLRVKQRFTDNLERASTAIQIVAATPSANGPFEGVEAATNYFEAMPTGRRAILLISDGLDSSRGNSPSDIISTPEMERAILKAQRRAVAVYSIWSPTILTNDTNNTLISLGQSALAKLSEQTGGRSFYQGSIPPVSFVPFLKSLVILFERQFALTYLSTHMNKGYHHVEVTSTNPNVKIEHPKGYYYR